MSTNNHPDTMDLFRRLGVAIELPTQDSFLKVRETLTRMGVSSQKHKVLYQSCHILHKRGEYRILHFKELFVLDGKPSTMTKDDEQRRNLIAALLSEWELVRLVDRHSTDDRAPINSIRILSHAEKQDWSLQTKYQIGRPANRVHESH